MRPPKIKRGVRLRLKKLLDAGILAVLGVGMFVVKVVRDWEWNLWLGFWVGFWIGGSERFVTKRCALKWSSLYQELFAGVLGVIEDGLEGVM